MASQVFEVTWAFRAVSQLDVVADGTQASAWKAYGIFALVNGLGYGAGSTAPGDTKDTLPLYSRTVGTDLAL